MSRSVKKILSVTRAAVDQYNMIEDGDKIAVGLSGGKDSLMLLFALAKLKDFYPKKFELLAVTADPCFDGRDTDFSAVERFCASLGIRYIIQRTELWDIVFNRRNESNPCSLCARMRRGILHRLCEQHGCSKIALGHHKNDVAETFMMNLLNGGTIGCFSPVSYLSRRNLHMIRPLIFLDEKTIISAVNQLELPIVKSACPVDGKTEREQMKKYISELCQKYGDVDEKVITAMKKAEISGW